MPKRKILFVITKSYFGGAQRYVYDLATSLPKDAYDVVVALGGSGTLYNKLQTADVRTVSLSHLQRDINLIKELFVFFDLLRTIRRERPDVVHVNSAKAGGLGALAARMLFVRHIVFTAHGWDFNNPSRGSIARALIQFFSWLTILLSHTTIAVSEELKRQIISLPFVAKKITVIHNGVRDVDFLPRDEARHELVKLHPRLGQYAIESDLWVGTVAELHPVKGLRYAIDAIDTLRHEVPTIRYLILSDGQERASLETHIKEKGLEDHVFLLGFVDNAPAYGKACDIFLLPSLSESLGIAILEAGQASLPVVATNVGGIPEIIRHEKSGLLVPSKDSMAIADALTQLIGDVSLRERLGEALRTCVEADFSLPQMTAKTQELY